MRVLSLFSGVGGMDMGLERAGHQIVGMCEIDSAARSVLARHWPNVRLHEDVSQLETKDWNGRIDLVAGGSPCQDLSVAGQRKGLDGERSGLFWHQCRIADSLNASWVLWENVAGALSSNNGADFAAVLWGITGALPDVPHEGWRSGGICVGPKRTAVWRMLDAQHFGVPQRRRRLFIVAGPGTECGPEVLFEPESLPRHSVSGREEREGTASTSEASIGSPSQHRHPSQDMMASHLAHLAGVSPAVTSKWAKGTGGPSGDEVQNLVLTPFVKVVRSGARDVHGNLPAEVWREERVAPTLNQRDVGDVWTTVAVAMGAMQVAEPKADNFVQPDDTSSFSTVFKPQHAVRRLTPKECERLMGWPDDWTRYEAGGKEIADSQRYRMCGNGVVSNVAEWIGRRLP